MVALGSIYMYVCVCINTHIYNITVCWCHHFNKVSVILDYLFPCPLARENRLLSASIGISRLPASSPPKSRIHEAKRISKGLINMSFLMSQGT